MTALYHAPFFLCDVCQQEKPRSERYYANRSRFVLCKMCASQGKHCSECLIYKAFSEFVPYPNGHNRGGVTAYCKNCTAVLKKEDHKKNYNPAKSRVHRLKTRFNLTQAEYDAMFDAQGGKCAICKKPETAMDNTGKRVRALAVDHDHETGKIRQLLCGYCNYLLGYAREDAELLQVASEYLRKHKLPHEWPQGGRLL